MTPKELYVAFCRLEPEQKAQITACQTEEELISYAQSLSIPLTQEQAAYGLRSFEVAKKLQPLGGETAAQRDEFHCDTPGWLKCKRCSIGPMVYVEYGLFQCAHCGNYASIWGW